MADERLILDDFRFAPALGWSAREEGFEEEAIKEREASLVQKFRALRSLGLLGPKFAGAVKQD